MNHSSTTSKWEREKREALRRLIEDLEIGYLDTDILQVLLEFFARPKAYTTSSCSGRITVMDAEYPWIKEETNIIFKSHEEIGVNELRSVLNRPFRSRLWLRVQGPIYHVYVLDLTEAREVLDIARSAGFKHSGILVVNDENVILELRTGIELSIPMADRKGRYINSEVLENLVELANTILREAKKRNTRLLEELRKKRPREIWPGLSDYPLALQLFRGLVE